MEEPRYWFLAPGNKDTLPEVAVSVPWWPEIQPRWVHDPEYGPEYLEAPMLFTTREAAEEWLDYYNDPDVALRDYQDLRERYGEETTERAYNNSLSLRVFGMSRDDILWRLQDSDFLCVMVDDRLRLRRSLGFSGVAGPGFYGAPAFVVLSPRVPLARKPIASIARIPLGNCEGSLG